MREEDDDNVECDFLFKRGVLKVAWFLFLVFLRALRGIKGINA
jgi:hypothetical protein